MRFDFPFFFLPKYDYFQFCSAISNILYKNNVQSFSPDPIDCSVHGIWRRRFQFLIEVSFRIWYHIPYSNSTVKRRF